MTSQEFLAKIKACPDGSTAVGDRTLKAAVAGSVRADWLFWLAAFNANQTGWPSDTQISQALIECAKAYRPSVVDQATQLLRAHGENFRVRISNTVDKIADGQADVLAGMCKIFRARLSIPFLDTLDR